MDLNLAVLLAEGEDEARMLRALTGWEPTGHVLTADLEDPALEAGPAVGVAAGWTILFDPTLAVALDQVVGGLATRAGRGIAAGFQGATESYAFHVYQDGLRIRTHVRVGADVLAEDGVRLAEEDGLDWDAGAEEALAVLIDRFAGIDLTAADLTDIEVRTLRQRPSLR
jgi:hypothetical protein